jgi:predicted nucleic acid-binding protein
VGKESEVKNILDAGPLIAALNRSDEHHRWARETLERLGPPFFSCPEALAEAAALTGEPVGIVEMVEAGEIIPAFSLEEESGPVLRLLRKYRDVGMDLADACIVRMSELFEDCQVITVDRKDFRIYRRNGRHVIPVIVPPA